MLKDILPAWVPGLVLFFYVPLGLYLPNQAEFSHNIGVMLPFLAACLLWLLAVMLLRRMLRPVWPTLAKVLFYFGVYVLLAYVFVPLDMGQVGAGGGSLQEPWLYAALELLLLVGVVVAACKTPWSVAGKVGVFLALALLFGQGAYAALELSPATRLPLPSFSQPKQAAKPSAPKAAQTANIYHILLDGFSSQVLGQALERSGRKDSFAGFINFPANRSNFAYTKYSVPSLFTGTFLPLRAEKTIEDWQRSIKDWQKQAREQGILAKAAARGYAVTQYIPNPVQYHYPAGRTQTASNLVNRLYGLEEICRFSDIWLLRLTPTLLKREVFYPNNVGLFTALLIQGPGDNEWAYWAARQMIKIIADEAKRPAKGQYVYMHLMIPHPPVVVDRACKYCGDKPNPSAKQGYLDQAACALDLAAGFIDTLKRLGRFDKSLIIIHADHGWFLFGPKQSKDRLPPKLVEMIEAAGAEKGQAQKLANRTLALLMIKKPGAPSMPLQADLRLSQLADLPNTIYQIMAWPGQAPNGRALLGPQLPDLRQISLFLLVPQLYKQQSSQGYWQILLQGEDWSYNPDYPQK